MSIFIDIHRHAADKGAADIVLRNIFHSQTDEAVSEKYVSVGLHPWHVNPESLEGDLQLVLDSLSQKSTMAIGETGLDKTIDCDFEVQKHAFLMQLRLAADSKKPLVIHCVRAYNEMLSIRRLSSHKEPWIFHWFNSSYELGSSLIDMDCYLSFGHMLFKETSKAFKAFKKIPLDRIFLETDDAEFSIVEVYEKAAELKGIDLKALQKQLIKNFETCFRIKL